MEALRRFDLRRLPEGAWLAGVDEAGRGALAGPVVAGAVFVQRDRLTDPAFRTTWDGVNDSKQLSAAKRAQLYQIFEKERAGGRLIAAIGSANVLEIEQLNILGATRLAMRRALEAACPKAWKLPEAACGELFDEDERPPEGRILIDGRPLRPFPFQHEGIVKGDAKSFTIALASILAKVTRDHFMEDLDGLYPRYRFSDHKGYGTADHREAILQYGACPVHRPFFLRKLLGECEAAAISTGQAELFG